MQVNKLNSFLLVLLIYKDPLGLLFSYIVSPLTTRLTLLLLILFICMVINRVKFSKRFIFLLSAIIILILINIMLVNYKMFVISDSINFLLVFIVPIYIFTLGNYSFRYILIYWYKMSLIYTVLLPLYFYYFKSNYINYMDLGLLAHINSIILLYYIFIKSRYKIVSLIVLTCNLAISLVFGSRMILLSTLIVIVLSAFFYFNKTLKRFLIGSSLSIMALLLFLNIAKVIEKLYYYLNTKGIRSRNLSLINDYIQNWGSKDIYLAGRENIYPIIDQYLSADGLFPSGLSVARYLTNGQYYHAHSFYLEFPLVFGYLLIPFFLFYFIFKFIFIYKKNKANAILILIMLGSFLTRSITGTYFMTDTMLLIAIALLIAVTNKGSKGFVE